MAEITEKQFYQMRKRAGVCPKCGREDSYTMGKRTMCAECAELARKKAERRRQDPDKRVAMYSCVKAIKDARRSAGLCPDCGGQPMEGHVKCMRCVIRDRAYKRKYRAGNHTRISGMCWQCNKREPIAGKKLCPECYASVLDHLEKANRARLERGIYPYWSDKCKRDRGAML